MNIIHISHVDLKATPMYLELCDRSGISSACSIDAHACHRHPLDRWGGHYIQGNIKSGLALQQTMLRLSNKFSETVERNDNEFIGGSLFSLQ